MLENRHTENAITEATLIVDGLLGWGSQYRPLWWTLTIAQDHLAAYNQLFLACGTGEGGGGFFLVKRLLNILFNYKVQYIVYCTVYNVTLMLSALEYSTVQE